MDTTAVRRVLHELDEGEIIEVAGDAAVVQAVARNHQRVTRRAPSSVGALLPLSYSAEDVSWLWRAGIPCVYYGPAGGFQERGPEGSYILSEEMVQAVKVLALTALDFCGVQA